MLILEEESKKITYFFVNVLENIYQLVGRATNKL